jgi:hypothetical protein
VSVLDFGIVDERNLLHAKAAKLFANGLSLLYCFFDVMIKFLNADASILKRCARSTG